MKKFVRIQSTRNVNLFESLSAINMTNENSRVQEPFRVAQAWSKTCILVKQGTGYYPAVMKDWATVKTLVKNGELTIGEETDVVPDEYKAEAEAIFNKYNSAKNEYTQRATTARARSVAKAEVAVGDIVTE